MVMERNAILSWIFSWLFQVNLEKIGMTQMAVCKDLSDITAEGYSS